VDPFAEQSRSWEAIIKTVETALLREFRSVYPAALIEVTARESVGEFTSQDVRIKAFVPVLAGSLARRRLRQLEKRAS
jgi:hypothetical protein